MTGWSDRLRVVEDGPRPPPLNMGLDEALLAAGGAWLRFYGWTRPALSLGCFQRAGDFAGVPADIVRVRRPTGGGAILHADEITVALVVPEAWLPRAVAASYAVLNGAVAAAAGAAGIALRPPWPDECGGTGRWCFAAPTGLDLVLDGGRKVFGSAQRRRAGRVLQHGSLVLRRHPLTPFTGELGDVDPAALRTAVATEVAARLGVEVVAAAIPPALLASSDRLAAERYADPAWTARR